MQRRSIFKRTPVGYRATLKTGSAIEKCAPRKSDLWPEILQNVDKSNLVARRNAVYVRVHVPRESGQPTSRVSSGYAARLVRYAWGAFTVDAEIPSEGVTLGFDLAQLANAPSLFKQR
jgi:hypothetical protein